MTDPTGLWTVEPFCRRAEPLEQTGLDRAGFRDPPYFNPCVPGLLPQKPTPPPPPPSEKGCSIPEPHDNPTPEECCSAMQEPCSSGDWGGVVCCNDRRTSCVWVPPTNPAYEVLASCIFEHEDDHHDDVNCINCPSGEICRPEWQPGQDPETEECSAYGVEVRCLQRRLSQCTTTSCRDEVDRNIQCICEDEDICPDGQKPAGCP